MRAALPTAFAPPLVVDVSLSLAPNGLYWVMRLAEVVPVWLPQCHWAIVDDQAFYARAPGLAERLVGKGGDLAQITRQWRGACDLLGFESRPNLFWRGDGRADSVLPKNGDAELVERCDALAAGFEARFRAGLPPSEDACVEALDPLGDCARDTLALTAALGGARPIVILAMKPNEPEPELASRLAAIDVPCPMLAEGPLRAAIREALAPLLWRTGLAACIGSGALRLAGLSLVAPYWIEQPPGDGDDLLTWDAPSIGTETRVWGGAAGVWWEEKP